MTDFDYTQWLRDTYEARIARQDAALTEQAKRLAETTKELLVTKAMLQAATDMCDALKTKCSALEMLVDELLEEPEEQAGLHPELGLVTAPKQTAWLDNSIGREKAQWN